MLASPRGFRSALLLLSLASTGLFSACSKEEATPEPIRAVRTLKVDQRLNDTSSREYAAEIRARNEARLAFRVAGKLASRSVNPGDSVRAGQVLAKLDPQDLKLGFEQAQASLAYAESSLAQAQSDFKRYKELRDQGFIGAAELERRETTYKSAKAQYEQAEAQWSVQKNQATYANLVADVPGVVTGVDAEPGQVLAAGASVVRLAQDGPRDAVFSIPEADIAAFRALSKESGSVSVRVWGDPEPFPARVREVAGAADPVTRTFLVKAEVSGERFRLGLTATVSVAGAALAGTVKVPLSAIFENKGVSTVWLLESGSLLVQAQAVQIGTAVGNSVIVTSGLKQGDEVVVAGTHLLTPGQRVKRYVESASTAQAASSAASR
jgi:RND family efflux transporter MFP subunit